MGPGQPPDSPPTSYEAPRRIKTWMVLAAIGLILVVLGFVMTRGSTGGVKYQSVSFTTEGFDQNPVKISGLLIKPSGQITGKVPGVVFAHGFTGCKEWYLQMTREMAKQGLVVLSIDLRGHGRSGGACALASDEANDMLAAGEWMRQNVPEVDPAHVTAMGHSLGGVTATRAGIVQQKKTFSSVVAVWCWTSVKDLMNDMTGPIDAFVGRSWLFTTFAPKLDINAPDIDARFNMVNMVDDNKPPNYLLEIGSVDEMVSVDREQQLIEKATVHARRVGPEPKVKDGVTYGNFADGTARRLVVTNDDHLTGLMSGAVTAQAIDWIKQAAGQPAAAGIKAPFLGTRVIGLLVLGIGVVLLVLGALSVVRHRLFPEGGEIAVEPVFDGPAKRGYLDVLIYALPVLAASLLAMPVAKLFGMKSVAPYMVINETGVFNLTRTLILLPLFIALIVFVALRASATGKLGQKMREGAGRWVRSAGYALIPVVLTVILLAIIGGPLILPRVIPMMPAYFILGIIVIGGAFWLEDYLFYKLAYPALKAPEGEASQWKVLLVRTAVLDLVLIFALLPLMDGLGVSIHFWVLSLPLILVLLCAAPMLALMAKLSMRLRALTGGSLAFALMLSSLLAWAVTTVITVRGH